jgi:hypothetical protein
MFPNKQYSNSLIYDILINEKPAMIARLGSNELMCVSNYLGVKYPEKFRDYRTYISSKTPAWWWNEETISLLGRVAGFFPLEITKIEKFCEMMLEEIPNVDILGSWRREEVFVQEQLGNVKKVMLEDLEPFFTLNPWTAALENKRVLVVHPFTETITKQYKIKDKLFENNLLPDFELLTIKAVQSHGETDTQFEDWFKALDYMKEEISKKDFDICILGCGAYGFPLASFIKKSGKKAFHLGGVTQLLFGIKGKRWDDYIVYPYTNLFNQHWVRPAEKEKPKNAHLVESACYW